MTLEEQLQINKYFVVRNFITPEAAINLAKEIRNFFKNPARQRGDLVNTYAVINHIEFVKLLVSKVSDLGNLIGEPVLPTYSFGRIYKHNSELERHIDRNECEVSVTVHLQGDRRWPIHMKYNDRISSCILDPGDAVVYMGREILHWRDIYDGEEYIQMFLHYVKSNGEFNKLYFDLDNRIKHTIKLKPSNDKSS